MGEQSRVSNDKRIELLKNNLKFIQQPSVELTLPQVVNADYEEVSTTVEHNLGYSPKILAFITFPSAGGGAFANYTRPFGIGIVQAGTPGASSTPIIFVSEEEINSSSTDIIFRWKVSNSTGIAQPEITVTIDYYILTEAVPANPT